MVYYVIIVFVFSLTEINPGERKGLVPIHRWPGAAWSLKLVPRDIHAGYLIGLNCLSPFKKKTGIKQLLLY